MAETSDITSSPQPDPDAPPARPSRWNDPAFRALVFQGITLGGVIIFALFLWFNTQANLERQGIASGFGFLDDTAGFTVSTSLIEYEEEDTYGRAFLVGLLNTLLVSVVGVVMATILGFIVGIARLSKNWLLSRIAMVFVEVIRNMPLLLQLFFWYFAVLRALPAPRNSIPLWESFFLNNRGLFAPRPIPEEGFLAIPLALLVAIIASFLVARTAKRRQDLTGQQFPVLSANLGMIIGLPLLAALLSGFPLVWEYPEQGTFNLRGGITFIPEMISLVLALTIYTASFIAEIVRAGILSVSKGQTEAAYSLGLQPNLTLRKVIIPQALRVIIPPLTSQYLNLTKNSSLAAAIAYPDLVLIFAGITLNQTGQAVEVIGITMAVYLTISLSISLFMNTYNKRMALVER